MWNKIYNPPNQDGQYLVVVGNAQIHLLNFTKGKWSGHPFDSVIPISVTHWMPLPSLPEQKDWASI